MGRRSRLPAPRVAPAMVMVVVAATTTITGCGGGGPSRQDVLTDLADGVIVPALHDVAASSADLVAATSELCASPSPADLAAAREALATARAAWSYSEPMWVGPVTERRSWAEIDWPIAVDEIEALIADDTIELDIEDLGNRIGADQRGLGAVEHILGGPDDDAAVLTQLAGDRRCRYLTGVAGVIADEAALLPDDWTVDFEGGGPYRDTFAESGGASLDSLVNDAVFLLEAMADSELGAALGEMDREADVEAIVEGPGGLAVADLVQHLDGIEAVLVGDGATAGLRPLLGDELAGRLADQLDAARDEVAALTPPLRVAVLDHPAEVGSAREAIKAVQVTVSTEVVSRLGVTVGFSDADGDTGG